MGHTVSSARTKRGGSEMVRKGLFMVVFATATLVVFVAVISPTAMAAAGWVTTQLTDNDYSNRVPGVSGDRVVWMAGELQAGVQDSNTLEVYTWKEGDSGPTQITHNLTPDYRPQVSGDRVVWVGFHGSYNATGALYTWESGDAAPTLIVDGLGQTPEYAISGDRVAWVDIPDYPGGYSAAEVYTWKVGDAAPTRVTDNAVPDGYVQVSGDRLVWAAGDMPGPGSPNGTGEIYTWKVGEAAPTRVTDNDHDDWCTMVSGDRLAWLGSADASSIDDVFTWKVGDAAPTRVTQGISASDLRVSGDRLAWRAPIGGPIDDNEVFTWQVGDPAPTRLTDDDGNDGFVGLSGNRLVWASWPHGSSEPCEIYTWRAGDVVPTQLTDTGVGRNWDATVSGERVVWSYLYGATSQIRTAVPAPGGVGNLVSPTHPDEATWYADSGPAFAWDAASDAISGVDGYSYVLDQDPGTVPDTEVDPTDAAVLGFAPWTDYPTGRYATVATGDVNNDGKADIVTANGGDSTVSVLLGKGDGSFQAKGDYATGPSARAVAVGEFNGDGKQDVATRNTDGHGLGSVSVLLGNGDGTFRAKVDYPTGGSGTDVAVGDFNGDGKQDLATSSPSGNVSVLLGNGDGTFRAKVDSVGAVGGTLAVGDFNGDGKQDLVVANDLMSNWTASVLLGKADGTFNAKVDYPTGPGPADVAVGDFNGDGKQDLATANGLFDFGGDTVDVLLGKGDGTFAGAITYATGLMPRSVAVADFNGDGKQDLVTANVDGGDVSVLGGVGDGTFAGAAAFSVGSGRPRSPSATLTRTAGLT